MSSFYRVLQTSAPARYSLYATAAAGTYYATWKWHNMGRKEHLKHEKVSTKTGSSPSMHESSLKPTEDLLAKKEALAAQSVTSTKNEPSLPPKDPISPVAPEGEPGEAEPSEEEANTGAFDPVTGEINWDCPCLGGMAHGPCGPQFREAFSCFVYSEAEPKGVDCVEKFRNMQDCFREHPDVYAEELKDDGEDNEGEVISTETPPTSSPPPSGGEGLEILPPREPELKDDPKELVSPPPLPPSEPPSSPPPLPPSETPKPPPPLPPSPTARPPSAHPRPKPRKPVVVDPPASPIGDSIPGTTVSTETRTS